MEAVKKLFIAISAVLVWTAIPVVSANAVSVGQSCAKTTLGTRVSTRINYKPVIVVCRIKAGRKQWIRAAVQTPVTTTTSTTSTTSTTTTVPQPVISYTDVVDPVDPTLHTITIEGMQPRTYYLNVPPKYTKNTPSPLLLAFHGLGGSASTFGNTSQVNLYYKDLNFILVTPQGWGSEVRQQNSWNAGKCCAPANNIDIDDVEFVRAILDSISKNYSIDNSRIWAMGYSNGGMMSYRLACELSERISAIGVGGGALMLNTCSPPRPVSIIHIHGNLDSTIPFNGGGIYNVAPVIDSFKTVNAANLCSEMAFEFVSDSLSESTIASCQGVTKVYLINYLDQSHDWNTSWTKEILRFLFALPRK